MVSPIRAIRCLTPIALPPEVPRESSLNLRAFAYRLEDWSSVISSRFTLPGYLYYCTPTTFLLNNMDFGRASLCGLSINPQQLLASTQSSLHVPSSTLPQSQATSEPVPPEQRRNPRRSLGHGLQKPPTLVRQEERKTNFVDGLVGKCSSRAAFLKNG